MTPPIPNADAVELVELDGVVADGVSQYMQAASAARVPSVRVDGATASRIAELWRVLPAGEQARCHDPPYGLRFFSGQTLLLEASICWQCNNIFGSSPSGAVWCEFDATAASAVELLAVIREECAKLPGHEARARALKRNAVAAAHLQQAVTFLPPESQLRAYVEALGRDPLEAPRDTWKQGPMLVKSMTREAENLELRGGFWKALERAAALFGVTRDDDLYARKYREALRRVGRKPEGSDDPER